MEDDAPPGVPEWVVTYGDMMSLLLTFFIMLVSLSEVVADKKYRAVLDALQKYVGYPSGPIAPPGKSFPLNSLIDSMEPLLGSFTDDADGTGGVKTPSVEGDDQRVFRSREGNSRQVGESVVFAPWEVELSEPAKEQLIEIAAKLAGKPNKIEIRAHVTTDPIPPDCKYKDKFEISFERGRNVLQFLEGRGIDHERLRVTAASDIEPLPETSDKLKIELDRADVLITDAFVSEYVGPRHIPGTTVD